MSRLTFFDGYVAGWNAQASNTARRTLENRVAAGVWAAGFANHPSLKLDSDNRWSYVYINELEAWKGRELARTEGAKLNGHGPQHIEFSQIIAHSRAKGYKGVRVCMGNDDIVEEYPL